uniref:Uncharacterized protein n=1 Tax=Kalanchoe fedtschenkoi TaxID=63787 RepID=A0A7N0T6B4_KALFE
MFIRPNNGHKHPTVISQLQITTHLHHRQRHRLLHQSLQNLNFFIIDLSLTAPTFWSKKALTNVSVPPIPKSTHFQPRPNLRTFIFCPSFDFIISNSIVLSQNSEAITSSTLIRCTDWCNKDAIVELGIVNNLGSCLFLSVKGEKKIKILVLK